VAPVGNGPKEDQQTKIRLTEVSTVWGDCRAGKLRHIGVGRTHARTHVIMLVHDLDVRIINAATGELLRELVIDLTEDYQPTGRPPGPAPGTPRPPRRPQK
jgi:hypothetical protein